MNSCNYKENGTCFNKECAAYLNHCPTCKYDGLCKHEQNTKTYHSAEKSRTNKVNLAEIFSTLIVVALVAGFVWLLGYAVFCSVNYTTLEYDLSEIGDGVYGAYTQTSSTVPAHNYEMITICCNGNVHTFKGDVQIKYSDDCKPRAIVHDYNLVNGDDIWVYVPYGSITVNTSVVIR